MKKKKVTLRVEINEGGHQTVFFIILKKLAGRIMLTILKGFVVIVVLILLYLLMGTVLEKVLVGLWLILLLLVLSYLFGLLVENLWDQAAMSSILIFKKAEEVG